MYFHLRFFVETADMILLKGLFFRKVMDMDKKRIAIHEAGHLIMALILDLDVVECDISRKSRSFGVELGRCIVFDPDPVGVRKFLVAMAGVMAEDHFFSDDRGGLKDRVDALEHLQRFLRHYNRMPRYDSLKPVVEEAAELFHQSDTMDMVDKAALMMIRKVRIGSLEIEFLRNELQNSLDSEVLVKMVNGLSEPQDPVDWKQAAIMLIGKAREILLRFRKM